MPRIQKYCLNPFFFSNKNMTTGEGGIIVCDDVDLAKNLRSLRSHGMMTMTWDRHKGHARSYEVVDTGYNYRLDEIRAAIGVYNSGNYRQIMKEGAFWINSL